MANKKPNWTAWVLKFVGSLAFLDVVWNVWQAGVTPAGVFGPILFGLAVVMTVGFFIMTLVALTGSNSDEMKTWSMRSAMAGGFALLALLAPTISTAGWPGTWIWVALVGFVLAYVGTGMDRM